MGRPDYRSFLLRLWRVDDGDGSVWRASLQDALTGQRRGFANLEQLMAYLRAHIQPSASPGADATGPPDAKPTDPGPLPHS